MRAIHLADALRQAEHLAMRHETLHRIKTEIEVGPEGITINSSMVSHDMIGPMHIGVKSTVPWIDIQSGKFEALINCINSNVNKLLSKKRNM